MVGEKLSSDVESSNSRVERTASQERGDDGMRVSAVYEQEEMGCLVVFVPMMGVEG